MVLGAAGVAYGAVAGRPKGVEEIQRAVADAEKLARDELTAKNDAALSTLKASHSETVAGLLMRFSLKIVVKYV